jgi:phasin
MTESSKAAAEKARDTYRKAAAQLEDLAGDTQVPEAMRALAEKNIAQTREIYERSKDALDAVLESWERSFDAVGQGAVALNRKFIDIAQRNINSGFDLAKNLASAKNLAEAMEMQAEYWKKQLGTLQSQAEEMRTLSSKVTADATEPIKTQMTRGVS